MVVAVVARVVATIVVILVVVVMEIMAVTVNTATENNQLKHLIWSFPIQLFQPGCLDTHFSMARVSHL